MNDNQCQGLRVPMTEPVGNMKRCVRCGCASAYPVDNDYARCPVLRGELWKPRPTTDGRWDL
jgi:coenzyme F420-reducing hydrogenase gamma subunit